MKLLNRISLLFLFSLTVFLFSCSKDDAKEMPSDEQTAAQSDPTGAPCSTTNLTTAKESEAIPNRYIVQLSDAFTLPFSINESNFLSSEQSVRMFYFENVVKPVAANATIFEVFYATFNGFVVNLTEDELANIRLLPLVKDVFQDQTVSVYQNCTAAAQSSISSQTTPWGITRVGQGSAGSKKAWILDTGIDLDHEDLNVNENLSRSFVQDPILGFLIASSSPDDGHGHGTHCAGIIGAKDNAFGVVGVCPGTEVVAVKILGDDGSGAISSVLAGMEYAFVYANPGDVLNMSFGSPANSLVDYVTGLLANKGLQLAIAAGNDRDNANNYSPARVNGTGIYTISAFRSGDRFAGFSNFGNPPVDYGMPGVNVLSTFKNNSYAFLSGTSMAAPHMAGVLLANGANFATDGTVLNDPDNNPDPIAIVQ